MKRAFYILLILTLAPAFFLTSCTETPIPTEDPVDYQETYIVVLDLNHANTIQSTANTADRIKHFIETKGIELNKVSFIYEAVFTGFAAKLTQEQADMLASDKAVRLIEKDRVWILENPTISGKPTSSTGQRTDWGVASIGGPGVTPSVKVWILDTGIDYDHPDLNVNTGLSKTFVTNGQSADDDHGHGTHVSGTIGAKDNSFGVIGVAAGVELVAVKVLNSNGSGYTSWITAGLDYIAKTASSGDVVNISLGGGIDILLDEAVGNCSNYGGKDIYISVAAGNERANAYYSSPARIGNSYQNVVTISAHNNKRSFANFSNYGEPVEFCAPGVNIYSTYKGGLYATMSGTSMAAPHVAGIMALNGGPAGITYSIRVKNDPDAIDDWIAHR